MSPQNVVISRTESGSRVITTMESVNPGRDQVIHLTIACGILATLAVFLRFVARWRSKSNLGADDWWMLATLVPSYVMLAVGSICSVVNPAFLFHANDVSDHEWRRWPSC